MRNSDYTLHGPGSLTSLGDSRVAGSAKVVIGTDNNLRFGEFGTHGGRHPHELTDVECNHHRVSRRTMNSCACCIALAYTYRVTGLADSVIATANAATKLVPFVPALRNELQRMQFAVDAHGNNQIALVDS